MEYPSESLMNISSTETIKAPNAPCIRIQNHGTGDNLRRDPQNKSTDSSTYKSCNSSTWLGKMAPNSGFSVERRLSTQIFFLILCLLYASQVSLCPGVGVCLCFAFLDANMAQTD